MREITEKSKNLIAAHQKVLDNTQRVIDETIELISRLNDDLLSHQKFLNQQRLEMDKLIEDLGINEQ